MRQIPDHELVLITKGQGTSVIAGEQCSLHKGTLLYFHPGLSHSMMSDPNNPLNFYAVHFSYVSLLYQHGTWEINDVSDILFPFHQLQMKKLNVMQTLFLNINQSFHNYLDLRHSLTDHLLASLYYQIVNDQHRIPSNYSTIHAMEESIRYIHDHMHLAISVQTLAMRANLSPDYFTKCFKEYLGMTPSQYIMQSKVEKAKNMMLNESSTIHAIADALGFCDPFHFSKTFKRLEGISPSLFMKLHQ